MKTLHAGEFFVDEVRPMGTTLKRLTTFSISSATYEIYTDDDVLVAPEATATVAGTDVFAEVNVGSTPGDFYVLFTWKVAGSNETGKTKVTYKVKTT